MQTVAAGTKELDLRTFFDLRIVIGRLCNGYGNFRLRLGVVRRVGFRLGRRCFGGLNVGQFGYAKLHTTLRTFRGTPTLLVATMNPMAVGTEKFDHDYRQC